MIKGMEISINRLVEVYFDRYPRSLPSESTWDVEKVRSFNSREFWDGEADVLVNIDYNEPDGWGDSIIDRYQKAKPGQIITCTKEDLDEVAKYAADAHD